jgi:head-tail adaptor
MAGIGEYRHLVTFQAPTSVPDGDGGFVDGWTTLDPPWPVDIQPATVRDLERQAASTIVAAATHVVTGRYRADVQIDAQMLFKGRTFRITGVNNVEERDVTMRLFAIETI